MEYYYTVILVWALEGREWSAKEALKAMSVTERGRLLDACANIETWIEQVEEQVEEDEVSGSEYFQSIAKVMLFENGIVAVFDQFGKQIPRYQGEYEKVIDLIKRDAPSDAVWEDLRKRGEK